MMPRIYRNVLENHHHHQIHPLPLPDDNERRRRRQDAASGCCPDVMGFLIGLYHLVYSGMLCYKKTLEWLAEGAEMQRNNLSYSYEKYTQNFILPHAYGVSKCIMYSALGLFLLSAIFNRNVSMVQRWIIWKGVLDALTFIHDGTYREGLFIILLDVGKSILQLAIVWSLESDMRKDEATEERRDQVRQAIDEEQQQPPQLVPEDLLALPRPMPAVPRLTPTNRDRPRRLHLPIAFNDPAGRRAFPHLAQARNQAQFIRREYHQRQHFDMGGADRQRQHPNNLNYFPWDMVDVRRM